MAASYEIFIGLRYLRAKRRDRTISLNTFVSVTGITLGVAALIGTLGIMTGFKEDLQSKILGTTSHILVHDRMRENMAEYPPLVAKVEQVPHVLAATPFIVRQVLLTSQSAVQGIVLRGIDPKNEVRVTELGRNIKMGDLNHLEHPEETVRPSRRDEEDKPLAASEGETKKEPEPIHPGIILGKELSMRLSVFVGDTVNVVSPVGNVSAIGMIPKIRTFTVVAIFQTGMYEYDSSLAYISLKDAQPFFNMGNTVTGIEVKVDDIFQANEIARSVEHALGLQYWARDWMQLNRNLFSALKLEKTMMFLLLVLITLVASFNIVSTLTMIVTEKQREIAILKAMGATRKGIMRIFMLNGLVIGATGTLIGVPLGYAFLWLIQNYWTFDQTVYYISHVPVHVQAVDVILVSFSAMLISFGATLFPSWQAAKLDPAAALRYQ
jgi:lipoprotein-releasing system permease protein